MELDDVGSAGAVEDIVGAGINTVDTRDSVESSIHVLKKVKMVGRGRTSVGLGKSLDTCLIRANLLRINLTT